MVMHCGVIASKFEKTVTGWPSTYSQARLNDCYSESVYQRQHQFIPRLIANDHRINSSKFIKPARA